MPFFARSEFQRPHVSEWMTPPKSSNIPVWKTPRESGTLSRRTLLSPDRSSGDLDIPASAEEHFTVQLSPHVSITLHSPKAVDAYVKSEEDNNRRSVSMKIRSPRRRIVSGTSSGALDDVGGKDDAMDVEELGRRDAEPFKNDLLMGSVLKENNQDDLPKSLDDVPLPSARSSRSPRVVHRAAVLKEFQPSRAVRKPSAQPVQRTVQRVQLPSDAPVHSLSPPQKLPAAEKRPSSKTRQSASGKEAGGTDGPRTKTYSEKTKNKKEPEILNNCATALPVQRKRVVDVGAAQAYIRQQKKKRRMTSQEEKARQKTDAEKRQRRLEELRMRSMELAAASKRKKSPAKLSQVPDEAGKPEVMGDHDFSLGLPQEKPKHSFNQLTASNLQIHSQKINLAEPDFVERMMRGEGTDDLIRVKGRQVKQPEKIPISRNDLKENVVEKPNYGDLMKLQYETEVRVLSNRLKVPETVPLAVKPDINATLKKLERVIQRKIEEKIESARSSQRKDVKMAPELAKQHEQLTSEDESSKQELRLELKTPESSEDGRKKAEPSSGRKHHTKFSLLSAVGSSRRAVEVDQEVLTRLQREVRELASGFKELQSRFVMKNEKSVENKENCRPVVSLAGRPYPYSVATAVRNKWRAQEEKLMTGISNNQRAKTEQVAAYVSDFEPLSSSAQPTSAGTTNPRDTKSLSEDSGSELSSSILDSENFDSVSQPAKTKSAVENADVKKPSKEPINTKNVNQQSLTKSEAVQSAEPVWVELQSRPISSKSAESKIKSATDPSSSILESIVKSNKTAESLSSYRGNVFLIRPDSSPLNNRLFSGDGALNNSGFQGPFKALNTDKPGPVKSDSNSTQRASGVSDENVAPQASKELKRNNEVKKFTDPFQALLDTEFNILDGLQQNLARFVQDERMRVASYKTSLGERSGIADHKKILQDHSVQTSFSEPHPTLRPSTATEIIVSTATNTHQATQSVSTAPSVHNQTIAKESKARSQHASASVEESSIETVEPSDESIKTLIESDHDESMKLEETLTSQKSIDSSTQNDLKRSHTLDSIRSTDSMRESPGFSESLNEPVSKESESTAGISLQMLNQLMKDEELRSEHQLALIQLRQDAVVNKTKACLAVLEEKKRSLKSRNGGDVDGLISALKKKQRGILLRYQSERQEIDRLKRMHRIASEERKIMIKQQKQIQKMQHSTKDMMAKYNQKKMERQPMRKGDHQSDISEDAGSRNSSTSIATFIQHSNVSDVDVSASQLSDGEDDLLKRNQKILQQRRVIDADKLDKCKKFLGEKEETLQQQKYLVEEMLAWEKRLEDEERRLREMKKLALGSGKMAAVRIERPLVVQDRSTSPFPLTGDQSQGMTDRTDGGSIPEVISAGSAADEIPEEISAQGTGVSGEKSSSTVPGYSKESFESSVGATKTSMTSPSAQGMVLRPPPLVKSLLSPRQTPRMRYSSGSDESPNLSHTETVSDPSDVECRLKALKDQLKHRKLEAERLKREQKRKQRERLKAKEEALVKQIQAYDSYIDKLRQDIEQENFQVPIKRPMIKQPKAEKQQKKGQREEAKSEVESIIEEVEEESIEDSISEEIPKESESKSKDTDSRVSSVKSSGKVAGGSDSGSIRESIVAKSISEISRSISEKLSASVPASIRKSEVSELRTTSSDKVEDIFENLKTSDESQEQSEQPESSEVDKTSANISENIENSVAPSVSETTSEKQGKSERSSSISEEEIASQASNKTVGSPKSQDLTTPATSLKFESTETKPDEVDSGNKLNLVPEDIMSPKSAAVSSVETSIRSELAETEDTHQESQKLQSLDFETEKVDENNDIDDEEVSAKISYDEDSFESISDLAEEPKSDSRRESDDFIGNSLRSNEDYSSEELDEKREGNLSGKSDKTISAQENKGLEELSSNKDLSRQKGEEIEDSESDTIEVSIAEDFIEGAVDEDEGKAKEDMTDAIAESIFSELTQGVVNDFQSAGRRVTLRRVDGVVDGLIGELLDEATDDALRICQRKSCLQVSVEEDTEEEAISPSQVTWDVRRRIHEIMSAQGASPRQPSCMRSMLTTTYDVTPESTSPRLDESAATDHTDFISSLALPASAVQRHVEVESRDCAVHNARVPPQEADAQEWFDEDFGLTKSRREAEILRQQQLQIEQEIQELQAQQQQQDPVPYFYLREIPNKPPPPYTPPGKTSPSRGQPAPAPTSEAEVTRHLKQFATDAFRAIRRGESAKPSGGDKFNRFLWDLAQELVQEACAEAVPAATPWERVPPPISTWRSSLRPTSEAAVVEAVLHRGLVLFGMRPRAQQETLIVKWSRKKRDQVDELLVWDSQAEEADWTRFDTEIQEVKNEVADTLWDSLLEDTALALDEALKNKYKRQQDVT